MQRALAPNKLEFLRQINEMHCQRPVKLATANDAVEQCLDRGFIREALLAVRGAANWPYLLPTPTYMRVFPAVAELHDGETLAALLSSFWETGVRPSQQVCEVIVQSFADNMVAVVTAAGEVAAEDDVKASILDHIIINGVQGSNVDAKILALWTAADAGYLPAPEVIQAIDFSGDSHVSSLACKFVTSDHRHDYRVIYLP